MEISSDETESNNSLNNLPAVNIQSSSGVLIDYDTSHVSNNLKESIEQMGLYENNYGYDLQNFDYKFKIPPNFQLWPK